MKLNKPSLIYIIFLGGVVAGAAASWALKPILHTADTTLKASAPSLTSVESIQQSSQQPENNIFNASTNVADNSTTWRDTNSIVDAINLQHLNPAT